MHDVVRDVAIYIGSRKNHGFLKSLHWSSIENSDVNCNWMSVDISNEQMEVPVLSRFPKLRLLMVKCAIGREREVAVCLMQKFIDKGSELQIRSAIALDHLKNYIYIEADKEAHVREAVKGMRNIYPSKIMLVPIKEMTDVLSVESKAIDISRDTWVRMKIGTYKGDLAKVVDVDNVRQRATVKLIPRIDLQALANKIEGREVPKKKAFTPPARFMNIDEARELHIRVERKRDPATGDYYEKIEGMMFKDGFLYKNVSLNSLSTQNVQPTFDELEKFRQPGETGDGDMSSLSTLFANRKKGHFMKGDRVIIVKGDLRNLKGWVEKVEEETVHIKPNEKGLPKTLAISDKELCKYFEARPKEEDEVVQVGALQLLNVVTTEVPPNKELMRVDIESKLKALKEREKSLKVEEKSSEKNRKQMLAEKEELLSMRKAQRKIGNKCLPKRKNCLV